MFDYLLKRDRHPSFALGKISALGRAASFELLRCK